MHLGAHMSIAGGLHKAVERIMAVDGTALQIFTRNQRQWNVPPLTDEAIGLFAEARTRWGDHPVAAHDSYLINMASPKPEAAEKSRNAFAEELRRCQALDIPWLVTHPGSHLGTGAQQGLATYATNLDAAIEQSETDSVTVLLETTAGQGTNLGSTFEELARIMEASRLEHRLGVCFDTCHAFAAGYDLRTAKAYEATFAEFDRLIGVERIGFFHLNDSKTALGEKKDRHEHIGKGHIGETGFGLLMNDVRFADRPGTLETDKGDDLEEDRRNLALLRSLMRG